MEPQIELEVSPQRLSGTAQQAPHSVWLRAIFWAFVGFSIFIIVNGNLFGYFGDRLNPATSLQNKHLLVILATKVVALYFPIAVVCGILCGIILAGPKRHLAWLLVTTLLAFATGVFGLCLIVISACV